VKTMNNTDMIVPKPQAILQAWMPFKEAIGVTSVHTEEEYVRATATIDMLLDEIGDNENHPLVDVLDYLADQVKVYEDEHFSIPKAEPHDVLRFLMDQHGLRQEDLGDCAPQSRISEILAGKRAISKEIAKRLAKRLNVHGDVFL
jgi:HTH-type transcriptional regulator / antitoxin HigA